jgi:FlaA1/EpsC-like NDP-sugar epimerase
VAAPAELWKLRRDVVGSIGMGSRGKLSDRAVRLGLRTGLTRKLASLRVDVSFAFVDALLVAVAYSTALILRFVDQPEGVPLRWWIDFRWTLPVIVAVHVLMNVLFGTYGHVWEHASIAEATRLVFASLAAGSLLLTWVIGMRAWLDIAGPIPVGSLVLGALLTVMLTGVVRFRTRLFSFNRHLTAIASTRRVLIVGTGQLAATLARHRVVNDKVISVVGFVATDEALHERRLAGLPILGTIETLPDLVRTHDVDEVIVATADGAPVVRRLIDVCLTIDVRLRIVPDIGSVLEDHGGVQDVRDLEPEDLLERPPVHTDLRDVAQTMAGKRVLVTGAGGSIGSELVKQILALEPAALLVLDHDETHLHQATQMWSGYGVPVEPILCDIRDRTRLLRAFAESRPQVVFHAAAHKHVPILEACPEEAVKTNVLGTEYVLQASRRIGVERFVLISTDKACQPVGVMGASKRVAEMLVQASARVATSGVYSAVRFGNVLGSRGSVVPTFVDQIKRGGPVTVTDPEMTRYFMTIAEAVELVLQASAIADNGDILVLDMGEPVRIVDLAHRLIRMAGLVPGRDIEVRYTGRRPGEKLHETLSTRALSPSAHPSISLAETDAPGAVTLHDTVNTLVKLANEGDSDGIRGLVLAFTAQPWTPDETIRLDDFSDMTFTARG